MKQINADWEDYEEPIEHWCITMYGGITRIRDNEEPIEDLIHIGNYFPSKEDAYDALYKLVVWKRLKDKGLRFVEWQQHDITEDGIMDGTVYFEGAKNIDRADLDFLFGGEERKMDSLEQSARRTCQEDS